MERDLDFSEEQGEFVFHYQPIISTDHGQVSDLEALVRFQRRDGTLVPPSEFIPQMEADGSISAFTRTQFPRLVRALRQFQQTVPEMRLAFNMAAQSLLEPDCATFILDSLEREEIAPRYMQLEVLETGILQRDRQVEESLRRLAEAGMQIAMDDYGTGYSSIDTLSLWPFTTIKIDRNLVRRMSESEKATTIVETSIQMAHQLGIVVVAEGIEKESQYHFLASAGCDKLQGFWIGRPMPMEEVVAFIEDRKSYLHKVPPIGLIIQAQIDHLAWRRQLLQELGSIRLEQEKGESRIMHRLPELDHHHCRFGRWFYSARDEEYTRWPEFEALREPHRTFHQLAEKLITEIRQGEEVESLLSEMDRITIEIVELLQKLEVRSFLHSEALVLYEAEN